MPWLGQVPENWEVIPISRIGQLFKGNGGNKEDEVPYGVPCVRYGELYTRYEFFIRSTKACVETDRAASYTPIQYGDVLFAASGETIEDIGRSAVNLLNEAACCGGDVLLLRPEVTVNPIFLGYAADAVPSKHQKGGMGRGFTVVHIYASQLKRLMISLPPLPEQSAIVRYLDYMDRRIRRYIHAKQKLIKLLEEQKQAIIHRAVTRGLDPNVKLKPSGVEWLGDVPEHWEIRAFTRCAIEQADYRGATPSKTENGVFLVTAKNIRKGWIDYEVSKEFVSEAEYPTIMRRGLPRRGDLLFTTEAPLGNAALVDREDVALAQRVIRFRVNPNLLDSNFTLYSVLSPYFQNQILLRGTGSTALGIKASKLSQLQILCPPLSEQKQILNHIEGECIPLEKIHESAISEIALLREYRTRLIADVVTGKLDVREAAASLPDGVEEPEVLEDEVGEGEGLDDEQATDLEEGDDA